MATVDELLGRLADANARFTALRPALDLGEPWPLADAFGIEPEASWGPPEVLAHVSEMLRYWLGEIERVIAGAPEPVSFGRLAADELRIGIIGRDRTLPLNEHFSRIAGDIRRYRERLPTLTPDELAKVGVHPVAGEIAVLGMVERFAVRHMEEHAEQLETILPS
jgi:hypothetical protein